MRALAQLLRTWAASTAAALAARLLTHRMKLVMVLNAVRLVGVICGGAFTPARGCTGIFRKACLLLR